MIKLPKDRHGNEGWVVKARKPHRCEGYRCTTRRIEPGQHYYRAIAWPGDDVNSGTAPWVLKLCRECLQEPMRRAFDAIVSPQPEPTALQMQAGPWRDIQGDVWTLGAEGLLHTPETAAFSREHVEKKWGPLVLAESITAEAHPPAPALAPGIDTPAPPTPAKPADGRTEPQGENDA